MLARKACFVCSLTRYTFIAELLVLLGVLSAFLTSDFSADVDEFIRNFIAKPCNKVIISWSDVCLKREC